MHKAPPSGQWLQQTKTQYSATLQKVKQDCLLEVARPLFQLTKTLGGFFFLDLFAPFSPKFHLSY